MFCNLHISIFFPPRPSPWPPPLFPHLTSHLRFHVCKGSLLFHLMSEMESKNCRVSCTCGEENIFGATTKTGEFRYIPAVSYGV